MADVFISYSRKDADFVRALHGALSKRGRDVWVDWEDIAPSVEWREELHTGIDDAGAVVFVISPASLASAECGRELERALETGKRVVPVVLHEPDGQPVPEALAARNWIFFREGDDFSAGLTKLEQALDTDSQWVREHTRLVVRAEEWERTKRDRSLLLRGNDLKEAERDLSAWRNGMEPVPTGLQREYVAASRRAAGARTGALLAGSLVALAISIVLGILALVARNAAEDREREAKSRALAVAGLQRVDSDPELATLLAAEAVERDSTPEAEEALRRAVSAVQARGVWRPARGRHVDLAPRGRVLVATTADGRVLLRETRTGRVRQLDRQAGDWNVEVDRGGRRAIVYGAGPRARIFDLRTGAKTTIAVAGNDNLAVAFSKDGRYLVGLDDRTARRWTATGRRVGSVVRTPDWTTFGISHTGRRILVIGSDKRAQAFDLGTGARLGRQRVADVGDGLATLSRDGAFAVSNRDGGAVVVWDTATGRVMRRLTGHDPATSALDISPDGAIVATGGSDNRIRLWDRRSGRELRVLRGHGDTVNSLVFSDDGHRLLSGSLDGTNRVWFAETGEQDTVVRDPSGTIQETRQSLDLRWIVTFAQGGAIRLWETSPGRTLSVLRHRGGVEAAVLDPSGRRVATSGPDGLRITRVDGETITTAPASDLTKGPTEVLAFDPSGDRLAIADGAAAILDDLEHNYTYTNHEDVDNDLRWSADGRRLITASGDRTARVLDGRDAGREIVRLNHPKPVLEAAFTPDGRRAVTATDDGWVRLWRLSDRRELDRYRVRDGLYDLRVSPDGRTVAIAGVDDYAHLWRPQRPGVPKRLEHRYDVNAVRFTRDGRRLATASDDGTARVWSVPGGRPVAEFSGHLDPVNDVDFSPDGRFLISASGDRTAKLWDVQTKRLVGVFGGHDDRVREARFAARGTTILTRPDSGAAGVYACDACGSIRSVLATARRLVPRELTEAERRRFLD